MSRKYAAVLLALVLTLQTASGAVAGEVTEDIMQETEALAVLDASEYPAEEDALPADESGEEVEIVTVEDDSEDFLPEADEIIEADPAEEDMLEIQGISDEEESALGLIEEDDCILAAESDDEEPTDDIYEENGEYYYNVAPGASLTLELPSGLPAGASDFSWIKYVADPYVNEYGDLFDETEESLGETSSKLRLDNIQETAAYKLSWRTSEDSFDDAMFRVRVKNGFRTYSAQANGSYELDENEQVTVSVDARAAETDGMQFVWFSCESGEYGFTDYHKLGETGSSYTVTAPRNASQYLCYAIDKYHNYAQYEFYVSRKNLIYNGPQNIQVVLSKGQTYTMVCPATTLDGSDDQLKYDWIKWPETLEVTSSSYTPDKIEDGDSYMLKVTDHYGNFDDIYWEFSVLEDDAELELRYSDYYQVPYGSGLSISVFAASGDTDTPITYQWYDTVYNEETDSDDMTLRPGDTGPVLELQNVQKSGGYACVVTQGDRSDTAKIYVSVKSGLKVDMPENGNSAFVVEPDSAGNATLTVNAVTDRGTLEYQWIKNSGYDVLEEGVSSITVSEPGYYYCRVDDGLSSDNVRFLVGHPTAGITDKASAPVLSSESPLLITHALNRMVYVKLEEAGQIGFRSVSDCAVTLLDAAGNVIDDDVSFGGYFSYDPEESGSPAYLAITTDYQDGLDDPATLVWCTAYSGGSEDDSDWGPWYMVSEPTCSFPGIMRRDYLYEEGAYEETYFGNPLGHMFGPAVVTAAPTVFAAGRTARTCARCGAVIIGKLPKLSTHLALNASGTVPLQVKKSSSAIKAVTMADGDYLLRAESSNTKLGLKVGVSGNKVTIKAGSKTGSSVITVRTAGGATATFKVKVQKAKVVAKKAVGFPKKLTLVQGQSYALNPVITPVTTPDKLKYSSSSKKVAAVSKTGIIQAKKKGKAVISLKVGKKTFKCKVTVR